MELAKGLLLYALMFLYCTLKCNGERAKKQGDLDRFNKLSDADVERIAREWDEDEDEDEELAAIRKRAAKRGGPGGFDFSGGAAAGIDLSTFDPSDPSSFKVDMSKLNRPTAIKGQPKMVFVKVNPSVKTKKQAEEIGGRWHGSLKNAHVEVTPYHIEDFRFLWNLDDGSKVAKIWEFLEQQKELDYLEVDQKKFYGKFSYTKANPEVEEEEKKNIKKRNAAAKKKTKRSKKTEFRGKGKKLKKSKSQKSKKKDEL
eukprot:m.147265 g.147265  ORF g.147265 m.147265 type:complete len:256 (+) comp17784_c0_seq1:156-923(+)